MTETESMVERVAKAIRAADMKHAGVTDWADWDETHPPHRVVYLLRAHAAIEAMREPTPGMVDAAFDGDFDIYWSYRSDSRPGGPADVWQAMIDAALVE